MSAMAQGTIPTFGNIKDYNQSNHSGRLIERCAFCLLF